MYQFTCDACGTEWLRDDKSIGLGYSMIGGSKVCYQCCASLDAQHMVDFGRIILYVTSHFGHHSVQNWPGTLRFDVTACRRSRNNFGADRLDVWFFGPDRRVWHGVNIGDNQVLRCKRTKRSVPNANG